MSKDYRFSHLKKSESYDESMVQNPWNSYMTKREQEICQKLVNKFFPNKMNCYIDFACGTGRHTVVFEKFAMNSYGIDVSQPMISLAKSKCQNTKFIINDITVEPLDLPKANLITAFRFFGNAQTELRLSVLNSLNKLLSDDGYLIINNHRNPNDLKSKIQKIIGKKTKKNFSPNELKKLMEQSGFEIVQSFGIGLWYIHHRLNNNRMLKILECIEQISPTNKIVWNCPDILIVAKKKKY